MQFRELTYKESRDLGKGWKTAGATVELSHGEDPDGAFGNLVSFIESQLGGAQLRQVEEELPPPIPGSEVPQAKEEKKEPAKKKAKTARTKKSKNVAYNREIELHKDTLSELLTEVLGDGWWEDANLVKKAKTFSEVATKKGDELFDDKGNVLDSFKELLQKEFASAGSSKPNL